MKKLLILIIVLGVFAVGFSIFYREGSLPVNKASSESKIFVIDEPGEMECDDIINLFKS